LAEENGLDATQDNTSLSKYHCDTLARADRILGFGAQKLSKQDCCEKLCDRWDEICT